jgi:hypothetical protein
LFCVAVESKFLADGSVHPDICACILTTLDVSKKTNNKIFVTIQSFKIVDNYGKRAIAIGLPRMASLIASAIEYPCLRMVSI